jgi:hypothetical protein
LCRLLLVALQSHWVGSGVAGRATPSNYVYLIIRSLASFCTIQSHRSRNLRVEHRTRLYGSLSSAERLPVVFARLTRGTQHVCSWRGSGWGILAREATQRGFTLVVCAQLPAQCCHHGKAWLSNYHPVPESACQLHLCYFTCRISDKQEQSRGTSCTHTGPFAVSFFRGTGVLLLNRVSINRTSVDSSELLVGMMRNMPGFLRLIACEQLRQCLPAEAAEVALTLLNQCDQYYRCQPG